MPSKQLTSLSQFIETVQMASIINGFNYYLRSGLPAAHSTDCS